jgi:hypothetical protein
VELLWACEERDEDEGSSTELGDGEAERVVSEDERVVGCELLVSSAVSRLTVAKDDEREVAEAEESAEEVLGIAVSDTNTLLTAPSVELSSELVDSLTLLLVWQQLSIGDLAYLTPGWGVATELVGAIAAAKFVIDTKGEEVGTGEGKREAVNCSRCTAHREVVSSRSEPV